VIDLERTLTRLGEQLERPDVDVWPAVSNEITMRRDRTVLSPLAVAAAIAVLVGSLLLIEPVRSTVAAWFGIGRTAVEVVPDLDAGLRTSVAGESITRDDAAAVLGRVPTLPEEFGNPDAWLQQDGAVVSVWVPSEDLPEIGTSGAGLILSELVLEGSDLSVKQMGSVGGAVFVEFDGLLGLWVEGPHVLIPPSGDPESVGSVLIWVADGIQFRLESALPLDRVIEIASNLR